MQFCKKRSRHPETTFHKTWIGQPANLIWNKNLSCALSWKFYRLKLLPVVLQVELQFRKHFLNLQWIESSDNITFYNREWYGYSQQILSCSHSIHFVPHTMVEWSSSGLWESREIRQVNLHPQLLVKYISSCAHCII